MIESSKMNLTDQYHKWIEWSEEDQIYIGKCPDLITGIHGDDPTQLYSELCEVVEDVIQHFVNEGRELPPSEIRPMLRNCIISLFMANIFGINNLLL